MNIKEAILGRGSRLETAFLLCWYVTIASAAFGDCLLRIKLPIGGHFFLFRGAILLTCLLYLILLLKGKENPLKGLSRPELWFVGLMACMLAYGLVSVLWSLSIGAWFSKLFTMCQMFALTFIFLKVCRDPKVMRITMALVGITALICAVGGLIECFHGPFFDTPYRNYTYVFFDKWMYPPTFTFYNGNGMAVFLLFSLETLYLWMASRWEASTDRINHRLLWRLSAGMAFAIFLCCAVGGRLALLAIPIILVGLAGWLFIRYKKGLLVFVLLFATLGFIYVGENYGQVRFYAQQAGAQIQQFFEQDEPAPSEETPSEETPSVETPPDSNSWGTLYTIIPSITGKPVNESLAASDGVRLTLLKNAMDMLIQSHGLGVGLGNAELRMEEYGNTGSLTNIHCFIMEVMAEFGVFALIPFLLVLFAALKSLLIKFTSAIKARDKVTISNVILLFCTALAYPLLSTANSSSWGISSMWMYLACLLMYCGKPQNETAMKPQ